MAKAAAKPLNRTLAAGERSRIAARTAAVVAAQPVTDLHTHCYSPRFGASPNPEGWMLWGIDELLTYHYLIAEVFRVVPPGVDGMTYETFWGMTRAEQADHIWKHLFVGRTPLSEACRGVVTTLAKLGLDPREKSLKKYRAWFAAQRPGAFVDRVMELANVDLIHMTNEVFDDRERKLWLGTPGLNGDPRFKAVLRIDKLLLDWPGAMGVLAQEGRAVTPKLDARCLEEVRAWLREWVQRMSAVYIAVSLPPGFRHPDPGSDLDTILEGAVLPVCEEFGIPMAMMIGVTRGVNPSLRQAGDMSGRADITAVTHLLNRFPRNRFLLTMLARENQHELAVAARKFPNLLVFGCWWFINNPALIEENTRMRMELLGSSFVPQHSDARILDQLIYKWDHSRRIIAKVLADKYADLAAAGYEVTPAQMRGDARLLLRDNFRAFAGI